MPEQRLLSICIPTYNRAALLEEALRAILGQMDEEVASQVEIVVADNASPDPTGQVVAGLQQEYPYAELKYLRRPETIDVNANIYGVACLGSGKYIFILSDDDLLQPGALRRIFAELEAHPDLDALSLNAHVFHTDPNQAASVQIPLAEDLYTCDRDLALTHLGVTLTFISCLVFRQEVLAARDYTSRVSTFFPHAYIFLDALVPGRGCLVTRDSYLAMRSNAGTRYNLLQVFLTNFQGVLAYALKQGYAPGAVRDVTARQLRFVGDAIYAFKQNGTYPASPAAVADGLRRLAPFLFSHPLPAVRALIFLLLPASWITSGLRLVKRRRKTAPEQAGESAIESTGSRVR